MRLASKEITFDAAHLLTGHPGKCRNLHGHTYRLVVTAAETDAADDMVIDFRELKQLVEEAAGQFDHAFMYDGRSEVEREIAAVLERHGLRTRQLGFRTTAENLAKHFFETLSAHARIVSVKVYETPTSCAEYRDDGRN